MFDLTDPLNPARLSSTVVAQLPNVFSSDIAILRPCAILAGATPVVVDISDPRAPKPVGTYNPVPQLPDAYVPPYGWVTAWQNHLVAQNDDAGIEILDVRRVLSGLSLQPWWSGTLRLTWEGAPGLSMQRASLFSPAFWEPVPNTDGQSQATVSLSGPAGYFRLVRP